MSSTTRLVRGYERMRGPGRQRFGEHFAPVEHEAATCVELSSHWTRRHTRGHTHTLYRSPSRPGAVKVINGATTGTDVAASAPQLRATVQPERAVETAGGHGGAAQQPMRGQSKNSTAFGLNVALPKRTSISSRPVPKFRFKGFDVAMAVVARGLLTRRSVHLEHAVRKRAGRGYCRI